MAQPNSENGFMRCPCVDYQNKKDYSSSKTLHSHLLRKGFMPSYNCWTKHREREVMMEDNEEEEDDDSYPMFPEYGDTAEGGCFPSEGNEDNEEEDQEAPDQRPWARALRAARA
jgi:hypothetical protein